MADKWLTTPEAAQLTGYTVDHIRRLVKADKIKGRKVARDWLVSRVALLAYIRQIEKTGRKRGPKTGLDTGEK